MPKYFTPKRSAIRFANSGSAAFKRLTQTVENIHMVASDRETGADAFSGVIRYNIDDWKKNTWVQLYPPTINDVNPDIVDPGKPILVALTGTNFVSGSKIYLDDVLVTSSVQYIDVNHYVFQPPISPIEKGAVVTIVRPDFRSGSIVDYFFYEHNPIVKQVASTLGGNVIYNDGHTPLQVSGTYLKNNSTVVFIDSGDPTSFVSGNNSTWDDSEHIWLFTPAMPTAPLYDTARGVSYPIPKTGSFYVKVVSPSGLESNVNIIALSKYHAPHIDTLTPNQDIIWNPSPVSMSIAGDHFLPNAIVAIASGVSVENPSIDTTLDYDPNSIKVQTMPVHGLMTGSVYVINYDGQQSNHLDFRWVLPSPTFDHLSFDPLTSITTGSRGAILYIYGSSFSGTLPQISLTNVILRPTGETSPLIEIGYNPLTLSPGSVQSLLPTGSSGMVDNTHYDLILVNGAGNVTASNALFFRDVPTIKSLARNTSSFGLPLEVYGGTFYDGATQVFFGGVPSPNVVVNSPTSLMADPPAYAGGWAQVDVYVLNYGYLKSNVISNGYLWAIPPVISAMNPPSGSQSGMDVDVTLTSYVYPNSGVSGTLATRFSIDGPPETSGTTASPMSSNVARVHMLARSPGFHTLTASNGLYKATTFDTFVTGTRSFEYVADPTISYVSSTYASTQFSVYAYGTDGTAGKISGSNFAQNATNVYIGKPGTWPDIDPGVGFGKALVTWVDSGTVNFITPPIATSGVFDVTVYSRGVAHATRTGSYKYVTVPRQIVASPKVFPDTGGPGLVVNGVDFIDESQVILSGTVGGAVAGSSTTWFFPGNSNTIAASVVSRTPTSINVNAPASAPGVYGGIQVFVKNIISGSTITQGSSSLNEIRYEVPLAIDDFYVNGVVGKRYTKTVDSHLDVVTIVGSGFINNYTTMYLFMAPNNIVPVNLAVTNATTATFTPPNNVDPSFWTIVLQNGQLSVSSVNKLEYRNITGPAIDSISPSNGIISTNATVVTLQVSNNTMTDVIKYNGVTMTYSGAGTTTYTLTLPQDTAAVYPLIRELSMTNIYGTNAISVERVAIPNVTSIVPNVINTNGGTVAINGGGFWYDPPELVAKMGTGTLNSYVRNVNALTNVQLPAAAAGTYNFSFVNKLTSSFTYSNGVDVVAFPTISSIGGSANNIIGGTIIVQGTNYLTTPGYTTITVGGNAGVITNITTTQITANVPAHAVGAVDVLITNRNVASVLSASGFTYTLALSPILTSLSTGTIATTGDSVTLNGANFFGGAGGVNEVVYLRPDNVVLTKTASGSNFITVNTAARSEGFHNFEATNAYGTTNQLPIEFVRVAQVTSVTPVGLPSWMAAGTIPTQVPTTLNIAGSGFLNGAITSTITLGGVLYNPTGITPTSFSITVPAGLSLGAKTLVVNNRGVTNASATLANAATVVTPSTPNITNISPTFATRNEVNKAFTVTSPYLFGDEVVKVGGVNQTIYNRTANTISFYLANAGPTDGAGIIQVTLVGTFGTGSAVGIDVWMTPQITNVSPQAGPTDGYPKTIGIYGGPFYPDTTVSIATATGLTYQYINSGLMQATFTGGTAGAQILSVTNKTLPPALSYYTFIQTPHLVTLSTTPATVYEGAVAGQSVTIYGTGWDANTLIIDTYNANPYPATSSPVTIPIYGWAPAIHTFVAQKNALGQSINSLPAENKTVWVHSLPAAPTVTNSAPGAGNSSLGVNGYISLTTPTINATCNNGLTPVSWAWVVESNAGGLTFYPNGNTIYASRADNVTFGDDFTRIAYGHFVVTDAAGRQAAGPSINFQIRFQGVASIPFTAAGVDSMGAGASEAWIFHDWTSALKPKVSYAGPGDVTAYPTINVSVWGGNAPFTYTWNKLSDDSGLNIGSGCRVVGTNAAQFVEYFGRTEIGVTTSTWNCTISDAAGHSITTPTITVTFELIEEFMDPPVVVRPQLPP